MHPGLCGGGHREGKKLREAARLWARGELISETQHVHERADLDEALAAFGLELEGASPGDSQHPFFLWPENLAAWNTFMQLRTQWRHGMAGPTGLDYAAVLAHLQHGLRLPRRKLHGMYGAIRALEAGYLDGLSEREEQRQAGLGGSR